MAFPGGFLINPAATTTSNTTEMSLFAHLGPCAEMWPQDWNFDPNGQAKNDMGWYCLTVLGGPGPWVSIRYCNGDPSQGWDVIS